MRNERLSASMADQTAAREMVWLLGQPHLVDYLDFVKEAVVDGQSISPRRLADEWRAANDYYYDLEKSEAGAADEIDCRPLPVEMRPLARRLRANRFYREAFDTLPATFAMVELDRLVVSQTHVERQFADSLCAGLGPSAGPEELFRFCLPTDREPPPVRVQQLAADRYLFVSESTDFRPHPAALLNPGQISRLASFGPVAAAIGLVVGYGSNFLSAIRSGSRLLLHNGYHRAYALRALGFTHAPCIVTEVTRKDELQVAAGEKVSADPEFYFLAARPPLLRDFFDPRIRKILTVRRMETVIEIEFKLKCTKGAVG